jgi:hypothetical protein
MLFTKMMTGIPTSMFSLKFQMYYTYKGRRISHQAIGGMFFHRNIIRTNWRSINRTPLQRAGNLVRIFARRSIRRRGYGTPPNRPPGPPISRKNQSRDGTPYVTPPFKLIYSVPEGLSNVVVGMVGFTVGEHTPVPGVHEHGGYRQTLIPTWYRGRMVPMLERVRYPKRPFMIPALNKVKHRFPLLWKNAIMQANMRTVNSSYPQG